MKNYAILLDATICTGCNSCTYKCIQENRLHAQASRGLFRTFVEINDEGMRHHRCMICKEPACVEDCPVEALKKTEYGAIVYDAKKCVGCKTCIDSCPFGVPQFDPITQKIVRCNMCAHRVKDGRQPACVEVCPNGALTFGEYEKIVAVAKERASKDKLYTYGLTENGGGQFITITNKKPADLGYPKVAQRDVKPKTLAAGMGVPGVAALAIGGLKIFSDRRAKIEAEAKDK